MKAISILNIEFEQCVNKIWIEYQIYVQTFVRTLISQEHKILISRNVNNSITEREPPPLQSKHEDVPYAPLPFPQELHDEG